MDKGLVFEIHRDLIDVTSDHRPNLNWIFVDKAGHYHQWYDGETLATTYRPQTPYHIPSIEWIKTGNAFYPDGSEYDIGYHRCKQCKQPVEPGYTADTVTQYIPGMVHFYIDGREVSELEFKEAENLV